jgi:hypothetical protein
MCYIPLTAAAAALVQQAAGGLRMPQGTCAIELLGKKAGANLRPWLLEVNTLPLPWRK